MVPILTNATYIYNIFVYDSKLYFVAVINSTSELYSLCSTKMLYVDNDQDTYGNSTLNQVEVCPSNGFSLQGNDCNDSNSLVYPGTNEQCYTGPDGTDNVGICHSGEMLCNIDGNFGNCLGI